VALAASGELVDRVAIVTGGGKGIGAVYCEELAREGAFVAVADVDEQAAAAQAERLLAAGGKALGVHVDVAEPASVDAMVRDVVAQFGRLDILLNNAAIFTPLHPLRPFWELPVEEWHQVMQVNVTGLFLCVRAAFPHLMESGRGRIVNIASTVALQGTPGFLHYVSSKAAVIGFTRALAREVGPYNITANAIAPGLTASETLLTKRPLSDLETLSQRGSIQRVQVPQDLVGAVVFLSSDRSAFITGQTLVVDGGVAFH
jgi:3-oxoacyl-[acyl-carrier protein] reductase